MSNALEGKPCWEKATGRYIGKVLMTGHGPHGFRCMVAIDEAGAVEDWPATAVVFKEPPKASAPPADLLAQLAAAGLKVVPISTPDPGGVDAPPPRAPALKDK